MSVEQDELQFDFDSVEGEPAPPGQPEDSEYTTTPRADSASESSLKAAESRTETERLDPQPIEKKLQSGLEFELEPLKLRQFLRLLRIVTRGAADILETARLNFDDPQEFLQTFVGIVLFSIPDAEEESIEFLKSMVRPKGLTGDRKRDLPKYEDLARELDNPELEDTVTIIQVIVETEAEDLRALGKRLSRMFATAQKMGATKPTPTKSDQTSD